MKEIVINPAKTVSFTGHRRLFDDFKKEKVYECIKELIKEEYDTFLVGMALGFDTICFRQLEEIRKEKNINIIACVPCPEQADKFTEKQRKEYLRMLDCADKIIVISQKYYPACMQKRNVFMVDNSSVLVCYKRMDKGGTVNTFNYAKKIGKKIIEL